MDWTTLAVAGMSLIGTLAGTFGGILVSSKLTNFRIEQLEKKQHDIRDLKAERR